jgi:hypothetical protein
MDGGIRERAEALRREIAEIQKLNLVYLQTPKPDVMAMKDHQRREQRLTVGGVRQADCFLCN